MLTWKVSWHPSACFWRHEHPNLYQNPRKVAFSVWVWLLVWVHLWPGCLTRREILHGDFWYWPGLSACQWTTSPGGRWSSSCVPRSQWWCSEYIIVCQDSELGWRTQSFQPAVVAAQVWQKWRQISLVWRTMISQVRFAALASFVAPAAPAGDPAPDMMTWWPAGQLSYQIPESWLWQRWSSSGRELWQSLSFHLHRLASTGRMMN